MNKWINIKDELPEKDGEYLCVLQSISMENSRYIRVLSGKWSKNILRGKEFLNFYWRGTHSNLRVTHWQELPELP